MWHCEAGTTTTHACHTLELTSRYRVRVRVRVRVVSQACGIAVPTAQCPTHATHVIYVTLTIKLGRAPHCDVYTRVTAMIQVCGIAVTALQRHTLVKHAN